MMRRTIDTGEEIPEELSDIEALGSEPASEWLSCHLLIPELSTAFSNNRKMKLEARALYKLCVLVKTFKPNYSDDFIDLLENYDFNLLRAKEKR